MGAFLLFGCSLVSSVMVLNLAICVLALFQNKSFGASFDISHPFGVVFGATTLKQLEGLLGPVTGGNGYEPAARRHFWESQTSGGDFQVDVRGWEIQPDGTGSVDFINVGLDTNLKDDLGGRVPVPRLLQGLNAGDSVSKTVHALAALGPPSGLWSDVAYWTIKPKGDLREPVTFFAFFGENEPGKGSTLTGFRWEYGTRYEDHLMHRSESEFQKVLWDGPSQGGLILVRKALDDNYEGPYPIAYACISEFYVGDVKVDRGRPGYESAVWFTLHPGAGSREDILILGPRADSTWGELLDRWSSYDIPFETATLSANDSTVLLFEPDSEYKNPEINRPRVDLVCWSEAKQKYVLATTVFRDERFSLATTAKVAKFVAEDQRQAFGRGPTPSVVSQFANPFGIDIRNAQFSQVEAKLPASRASIKEYQRTLDWRSREDCHVEVSASGDGGIGTIAVTEWRGALGSNHFPFGKLPPALAGMKIGDWQSSVLSRLTVLGKPESNFESGVAWTFLPYRRQRYVEYGFSFFVEFEAHRLKGFKWQKG